MEFSRRPGSCRPHRFSSGYREFAFQVFKDELGEELAHTMLRNWYFWQERLQQLILEGKSVWFDDLATKDKVEGIEELFHRAATLIVPKLKVALGDDPARWLWGKAHTLDFVSPIRRKESGRNFWVEALILSPVPAKPSTAGSMTFPIPLPLPRPPRSAWWRILVTTTKLWPCCPAGVSGRLFHPHYKDQIKAFITVRRNIGGSAIRPSRRT